MTDEEASKLNPGDYVEVRISGKPTLAEVVMVHPRLDTTGDQLIMMRRKGRRCHGWYYPRFSRWSNEIRRADALNPTDANVFADWLEEHGEPRAAAMLREAFPFCEGKPT